MAASRLMRQRRLSMAKWLYLQSTLGHLSGLDRIYWLLRDEFSDTRAAGAVNGTPATPGPGTRADVNNNTSIGSGSLLINSTTDILYIADAVTRAAGVLYAARLTAAADSDFDVVSAGFDDAKTAAPDRLAYQLAGANVLNVVVDGVARAVGSYAGQTIIDLAIELRATGAYFWHRYGGVGSWTEDWIGATNNTATLYAGIGGSGGAPVVYADFHRLPVAAFVAPQTAVDTLTRADGAMGSTETAGPEAQVVTARTWTAIGGDLQIVGNAAQGVAAQANVVDNGNMETGDPPTGWLFSGSTLSGAADERTGGAGAQSLNVARNGTNFPLAQKQFTTVAGRLYYLSGWRKNIDTTAGGKYQFFDDGGVGECYNSDYSANVAWNRIHAIVVAASVASRFRLYLNATGDLNGVSVRFDDASLVPCHAQYFDVGAADTQILANIVTPAAGTTPFGLILRRNGATQWLVKMTPGTAGTDFELVRFNNGVSTVLATADRDWIAATSYQIQVSLSGQNINVYDNGTLSLTYTTAAVGLTNTQFGYFDAAEGNASLADIQVMNKDGAYEALNVWAAV